MEAAEKADDAAAALILEEKAEEKEAQQRKEEAQKRKLAKALVRNAAPQTQQPIIEPKIPATAFKGKAPIPGWPRLQTFPVLPQDCVCSITALLLHSGGPMLTSGNLC